MVFKTVSISGEKCFFKLRKKDIIDSMVNSVAKIKASYNSRGNDSIFARKFSQISVQDKETGDIEPKGGLVIDLFDTENVAKAYAKLCKSKKTILECSTYIQMLFFAALKENANRPVLENICKAFGKSESDSFFLLIKPFCTKAYNDDRTFYSFEDFFSIEELDQKTDPKKIGGVNKGDVIYVENYDIYPTERNGAYSGEWCIVIDDTNKKNPEVFGFGIGKRKYLDVKGIMKKACIAELAKCGKPIDSIDRNDKVGISVRMSLNSSFCVY